MSGYSRNLSTQQQSALDSLRQRCSEELPAVKLTAQDQMLWNVDLSSVINGSKQLTHGQEVVLLKFLRAREFNVEKAMEMLKNTLIWRRDFDMESLKTETFPEAFGKLGNVYGKDKNGHPITWNYYADIDSKQVFDKFNGPDAFIRWRVQLMEKAIQFLDLENSDVETITQIHDYSGVSFFAVDGNVRAASKRIVSLFSDHYPEFLETKLFLNIPTFMEIFYRIFSSLSSSRTRSKFRMLGSGNSMTTLKELIDDDNLPTKYGGTGKPNITA